MRRPGVGVLRRSGFRGISGVRGGGAPPFDPLTDPDLAGLWLAPPYGASAGAADDGTTLTVPDLGPNARHLTATGGTGRPAIAATGCAGKRAIDFSALVSGNAPLLNAAIGGDLVGETAVTVLHVTGIAAALPTAAFYARYGPGAGGDWYWRHVVPAVGRQDVEVIGTPNTVWYSTLRSDPCVFTGVRAAAFDVSLAMGKAMPVWKDGVPLVGAYNSDGGTPTTLASRTVYVGSNTNGTSPLKTPLGAMAIVKRVLSQPEIEQWTMWLRGVFDLGAPVRLLQSGDSITAADGWRRGVWDLYAADCAASLAQYGVHQPIGSGGLGATWQQNWHDGVSGTRVAQLATRMATTLASGSIFDPNAVMCLIGINDIILDGASAATVAAAWEALLIAIYDLRPTVKIKLMQLINNTSAAGAFTATVLAANALGPTAVANAIAARPGMLAEWVPSIYTVALADGTHPTTGPGGGYEAMAADYYPRIMSWAT